MGQTNLRLSKVHCLVARSARRRKEAYNIRGRKCNLLKLQNAKSANSVLWVPVGAQSGRGGLEIPLSSFFCRIWVPCSRHTCSSRFCHLLPNSNHPAVSRRAAVPVTIVLFLFFPRHFSWEVFEAFLLVTEKVRAIENQVPGTNQLSRFVQVDHCQSQCWRFYFLRLPSPSRWAEW